MTQPPGTNPLLDPPLGVDSGLKHLSSGIEETTDQGKCTMCPKEAQSESNCETCQSNLYCSTTCREADQPSHALLCATFTFYHASKRPSPQSRRCLFFPYDEGSPKFLWARIDPNPDQETDPEEFIVRFPPLQKRALVQVNERLRRKLSQSIMLKPRDNFVDARLRHNRAVIAATCGLASCSFRGPFVAYAYRERAAGKRDGDGGGDGGGEGQDVIGVYRDFDLRDYRNLVDYFLSRTRLRHDDRLGPWSRLEDHAKRQWALDVKMAPNGSGVITTDPQGWTKEIPIMVRGLLLNCEGELEADADGSRGVCEAVCIPWIHDLFYQGVLSDYSVRVGVPLVCMHVAPRYMDDARYDGNNFMATRLMGSLIALLDSAPDDARSPWGQPAGNVVVARLDRKPLVPEFASSLCDYITGHVFDLYMRYYLETSGAMDRSGSSSRRSEVIDEVSPAGFRIFCRKREALRRSGIDVVGGLGECLCGDPIHDYE